MLLAVSQLFVSPCSFLPCTSSPSITGSPVHIQTSLGKLFLFIEPPVPSSIPYFHSKLYQAPDLSLPTMPPSHRKQKQVSIQGHLQACAMYTCQCSPFKPSVGGKLLSIMGFSLLLISLIHIILQNWVGSKQVKTQLTSMHVKERAASWSRDG